MEIQEHKRRKALMSTTSNMSRSSDHLKNPGTKLFQVINYVTDIEINFGKFEKIN